MAFTNGKLDIIVGPMFSGKSTELIKELLRSADLGLNCLYINHSFDNRNDHTFSTHHPFLIPKHYKNIDFISLKNLKGLNKECYDVIGIDEAQFFEKDLIDFVLNHVETYRKHIIISGLDSDSNRNKFGYILDLAPFCDSYTKITSFCKECGPKKEPAIFTYKLTKNDNQIEIGSSDKYIPLCRMHFLEK